MTTEQEQIEQLLQSFGLGNLEGGVAAIPNAPVDIAAVEATVAGLVKELPDLSELLGITGGGSVSGLMMAPEAMDEKMLVDSILQQFEDLRNTLDALKSSPFGQSQEEHLVDAEIHLIDAQVSMSRVGMALIQQIAAEGTEPLAGQQVTPCPLPKSKVRRIKRWQALLCGVALGLPVALKLGIPAALNSPFAESLMATSESARVLSIDGTTLKIEYPGDGTPRAIQLAGVAPSSSHWQAEAGGVIAALIGANQGRASVEVIGQSDGKEIALVKLPNGMTLQQVLLEDGVAKLDDSTLGSLPSADVAMLQKAQASAKAQHKNIWSPEAEQ